VEGLPKKETQPRLLIIGLDSATFDLILPWIGEGDLPNLARLIRDGVSGPLRSTIPPSSPPAWTSFMTGKNPGKHGVFDFVEPEPGSYGARFTSGASRRARTLWRILSDAGVSVGVINLPMTYPPEPVRGYLLAGMDTPDENTSFVHPPELQQELARRFGSLPLVVSYMRQRVARGYRSQIQVVREWEEIEEKRAEVCLYLMEHHKTDLVMLHFFAIDQLQHHFWHYMDPGHPWFDPVGARTVGDPIRPIYRKADEIVGRLISKLPADSHVIVLSDHGAGPLLGPTVYLNEYLAQIGMLSFRGSGESGRGFHRFYAHLEEAYSMAHKLLPRWVRAWLARRYRRAKSRLDSFLAVSRIDWQRTKAFCPEVFRTGAYIRVNLRGREPEGIVEPGTEYEEVVTYLMARLQELKHPQDGKPVIAQLHRRDEIFHGPYLPNAPDLFLDNWEAGGFQIKPSSPRKLGRPIVVSQSDVWIPGELSGGHRYDGILVRTGKASRPGPESPAPGSSTWPRRSSACSVCRSRTISMGGS